MDEASTSTDSWSRSHPPWIGTGTVEVPVFYPTIEEMRDFPALIDKIENQHHAHLICGIAKIVPPKEFVSRRSGDYSDVDSYVIEQPVKEKVEGQGGVYKKTNKLFRKSMTVREYREMARSMCFPKEDMSPEDVEKHYWRNVLHGEPVYGADTPGSVCDPNLKEMNMNNLGTILDLLNEGGVKIKGVNTVYLYFGMWKATFPWHTEDMDLYSINYVHFGDPKFWYGIATDCNHRFERFAAQCFPGAAKTCKSFMRHKNFMISPHVLKRNGIKFGTMIQYANEFMITFPRGYHMGFNFGYNCAESTNFASDRWIDFGKNASVCGCRPDSVEIDMRPFMQRYRADEFDEWYQYWYGTRYVPKKRTDLTVRRQPIDDESDVESKKRRTEVVQSHGTRGSHLESATSIQRDRKNRHHVNFTSVLPSNHRWRKEVENLWAYLPLNLDAEKDFNERRGFDSPHCCICQYFVPKDLLIRQKTIPEVSRRITRRAWFAKEDPDESTHRDVDSNDRLYRCCNCCIVVHRSCYPIFPVPDDENEWRCARCRQRDDLAVRSASCHLCELRGGALIPTEDSGGEFVHVICALLNRRTVFPDPLRLDRAYIWPLPKLRSPVRYADRLSGAYLDAFGDVCERAKHQCEYCQIPCEGLLKCMICDETMFHATCGRLAGVSFEFRSWPDLTIAVCPDHNEVIESGTSVSIGDSVRVSVEEFPGRLLSGNVVDIKEQICCTVNFMDRNWSDDVQPDDIVDCQCSAISCEGWHVSGAKIKVRWDDGEVYDGYFRNRYIRKTFMVRLSARFTSLPSVVEVSRDCLFARGEKPVQ